MWLRHCTGLRYALTVRDFLPSECSALRSTRGFRQPFVEGLGINHNCPYRSFIQSGIVSGHPDFNRNREGNAGSIPGYFYANHKINGQNGFIRTNSNPGRLSHEKTIEEYTVIASSGLAKPVYCKGNSELGYNGTVRCGLFEREIAATGTSPARVVKHFATVSKHS